MIQPERFSAEQNPADTVWYEILDPVANAQNKSFRVCIKIPSDAIFATQKNIADMVSGGDGKRAVAKLFRLNIIQQVCAPYTAEVEFFSPFPLDIGKIITSNGSGDDGVVSALIFYPPGSDGVENEKPKARLMPGYVTDMTAVEVLSSSEEKSLTLSSQQEAASFNKYYYRLKISSVQGLLQNTLRRRCFVAPDFSGSVENITDDFRNYLRNKETIENLIKAIMMPIQAEETNNGYGVDVAFQWEKPEDLPHVAIATQFDETDENFLARMAVKFGFCWLSTFASVVLDSNESDYARHYKNIEDNIDSYREKITFFNDTPFFVENNIPSYNACALRSGIGNDTDFHIVSVLHRHDPKKIRMEDYSDITSPIVEVSQSGNNENALWNSVNLYNQEESPLSAHLILNGINLDNNEEEKNRKEEIRSDLEKIYTDYLSDRRKKMEKAKALSVEVKKNIVNGFIDVRSQYDKIKTSRFNYTVNVGYKVKILLPYENENRDDYAFIKGQMGSCNIKSINSTEISIDEGGYVSDRHEYAFIIPTKINHDIIFSMDEKNHISNENNRNLKSGNVINISAIMEKDEGRYFCPPFVRDICISGGVRATVIKGDCQQKAPSVDMSGYYRVKYYFPMYMLDEKINQINITPPIPLLSPFSGRGSRVDSAGIYMPLINNTDVFLIFQEGNPDRPCIAGVAPDVGTGAKQKSVFSSESQNILRTDRGF